MKISFFILLTCIMTLTGTFSSAQKGSQTSRVIAHRGAWKNTGAPQNSIAALREAIKLNCYGSEFDVRLTSDGHAVVIHDPSHDGVDIDKSTFDTVRKLKLSNGEVIPTLEEYLLAGKKQKTTRLVLEIKSSQNGKDQTLALTRQAVALVKKLKMQKIVDYIAFDYDACKLVAELDPKANIAYLSSDIAPAEVAAQKVNGIDYHLKALQNKPEWIEEAHQHKMTVNVWTVNKEEDMKWFIEKRADFITTDEPELCFKVLAAR